MKKTTLCGVILIVCLMILSVFVACEKECQHEWKDATCAAPKTCSVCKATEGEALAHTWVDATCAAPKTCSVCKATEGEALGHTWVDATCASPKTCSVCDTTEGKALDHAFVEGKCSLCNQVDKSSEEYKYSLLKKKADNIAFSCAKTVLRGLLKNPNTMEVLSEKILDSDDYFRYYVMIEYTAQNSLGGYVTDTAYVLVRVNPKMDGTFYYTYNKTLGIKYPITESSRSEWGWDTEPDDWSLDAANNYADPIEVSMKLILANPNQYDGKYVKIKEKLVISSNDLTDKSFRVMISTGDGKYDYNTDNFIEVFYRLADNVDDCIMLDSDHQKITVVGEIKIYSNTNEAYIEAYEIVID